MTEPALMLLVAVLAGAPLFLLPGVLGLCLSATVAGTAFWIDHRLQESVRRLPARVGSEAMPGQSAVVLEPLDPAGIVRCAGEKWRAVELLGRSVPRGQVVSVVRVWGLQLEVELIEEPFDPGEEQ